MTRSWKTRLHVALFSIACGGLIELGVFAHRRAEERAAADVRALRERAGGWLARNVEWTGVSLPVTRFVEAESHSGIDSEVWGLAEVSPSEITTIRRSMYKLASRTPRSETLLDESDDVRHHPRRDSAPAWWRPEDYSDADALYFGPRGGPGVLFIFSESRSRAFILQFDI